MSVCQHVLFDCLFACLSIYPSIHPSIHLSIYLSDMWIYQSVDPFIYPSFTPRSSNALFVLREPFCPSALPQFVNWTRDHALGNGNIHIFIWIDSLIHRQVDYVLRDIQFAQEWFGLAGALAQTYFPYVRLTKNNYTKNIWKSFNWQFLSYLWSWLRNITQSDKRYNSLMLADVWLIIKTK